jgi:hypothetical protein
MGALMTEVVLQDFYDHQRLWAWTESLVRPLARAELDAPGFSPLRTPYRAAMLGGRLVGVRPSPEGVLLFVGDEALLLDPSTDAVHVARGPHLVRAELRRRTAEGASLARLSCTYAPGPEELDTWEGRAYGIFDWVADRLVMPHFAVFFGLATAHAPPHGTG